MSFGYYWIEKPNLTVLHQLYKIAQEEVCHVYMRWKDGNGKTFEFRISPFHTYGWNKDKFIEYKKEGRAIYDT